MLNGLKLGPVRDQRTGSGSRGEGQRYRDKDTARDTGQKHGVRDTGTKKWGKDTEHRGRDVEANAAHRLRGHSA